jgi:hypothetical protein
LITTSQGRDGLSEVLGPEEQLLCFYKEEFQHKRSFKLQLLVSTAFTCTISKKISRDSRITARIQLSLLMLIWDDVHARVEGVQYLELEPKYQANVIEKQRGVLGESDCPFSHGRPFP